MGRRLEICIDANDPARLRPFWAAALGYETVRTEEGALDLADPAGVGPTLWFQQVPDQKTTKNRVHLDVWVDHDGVEALCEQLLELGVCVIAEHDRFRVLGDPEGNELCVCGRTRPTDHHLRPRRADRPWAWPRCPDRNPIATQTEVFVARPLATPPPTCFSCCEPTRSPRT